MSREAMEWFWKWGRMICNLPAKQYKRFMVVLKLLLADKTSVDEAVGLVS